MGVTVVAASLGDGGDGVFGLQQQPACVLDSDLLEILARAGAEGFAEQPFEPAG